MPFNCSKVAPRREVFVIMPEFIEPRLNAAPTLQSRSIEMLSENFLPAESSYRARSFIVVDLRFPAFFPQLDVRRVLDTCLSISTHTIHEFSHRYYLDVCLETGEDEVRLFGRLPSQRNKSVEQLLEVGPEIALLRDS